MTSNSKAKGKGLSDEDLAHFLGQVAMTNTFAYLWAMCKYATTFSDPDTPYSLRNWWNGVGTFPGTCAAIESIRTQVSDARWVPRGLRNRIQGLCRRMAKALGDEDQARQLGIEMISAQWQLHEAMHDAGITPDEALHVEHHELLRLLNAMVMQPALVKQLELLDEAGVSRADLLRVAEQLKPSNRRSRVVVYILM